MKAAVIEQYGSIDELTALQGLRDEAGQPAITSN